MANLWYFEEQPQSQENNRDHEPEEIRKMEKRALYEMLALRYLLPPYNSRGITRNYLAKVYTDEVFRVTLSEIRHFEVDLTPQMNKKIGVINNGLLVRKLNGLLRSKKVAELGMDDHDPPDQVPFAHQAWLQRVARFIDPTNLTEFFESAIDEEPPLNGSSSDVSHIYYGRKQAARYFFRIKAAKANRKLWLGLHEIADTYRHHKSQEFMVEVLTKCLNEAKEKAEISKASLRNLVSSCGYLYTSLEFPHLTPEVLMGKADKQPDPDAVGAINMSMKL